jgi:glycosyltransferase involved in cell wall biosynthesis
VRICHIITSFGFGGAEKLLTDLVNIQLNDHEVHIIYLKGEPLLLAMLSGLVQMHKVNLSLTCARALRIKIKLINPDVVHTHLGHADMIGLWSCRGLPVKRFCTMHNIWFKWNWVDYIIFIFYRVLFKTVAENCIVIAISESVFNHVEYVLRVPKSRIKLLYNAIPQSLMHFSKEELRSQLNLPANSFCILFVGRLEIQKSVDTLIRAIKGLEGDIKDFRLVIVGDGSLRSALEKLVVELNLSDNISFEGVTAQVEKYFKASDVFVLPSVFEGFGIVILEAFRASVPVIATNIEGPRELIQNNVNGLLFEPRDSQTLTRQILELFRSIDRRNFIGENGFKSYKNNFDIAHYAKQIEELYLQ